ncbi:MAG: transcriptional regulator, LysR family [Clostridia bacterium]|nr:transcriptional regulator, LysR family [Clostridia bacterium]
MHIDYLKMFIHVVDQGSISKAAEAMNISQSALSQQIKSIEQTLNIKLLERSHNGVIPTLYGKIVYTYAQNLSVTYDHMLYELAELDNAESVLRIAATPIMYSYALPCTLYHVKNEFPNFRLEIETMTSFSIEEKILNDTADIGFIVGKPKNKELQSKKVFSDKIMLVSGEDTTIPSHISCDSLCQYPLLMMSKTQKTRQILDAYLQQIKIDPNKLKVLYELNSMESIKLSAVNGYGMAFAPYMSIKKELYNKQLRIINIDCFGLENEYYAIRKASTGHKSTAHKKLILYIEKILQDTIC